MTGLIDVLLLVGFLAIVYGVAQLSVPWAWIVGGVLVLAAALRMSQVQANEGQKP